jgi:hypothetical protein
VVAVHAADHGANVRSPGDPALARGPAQKYVERGAPEDVTHSGTRQGRRPLLSSVSWKTGCVRTFRRSCVEVSLAVS